MTSIAGELHGGVKYEFVPDTVDSPTQITGRMEFSPSVQITDVESIEFVDIIETMPGCIRLRLKEGQNTQKSLKVGYNGEYSHLPILSAPVHFAVEQVRSGNPNEANKVITRTYQNTRAQWAFRTDCRNTLSFDAFLETFDALAGFSEQFAHVQFRSGIGYFAKRIRDNVPSGIHSFDILEERIQRWNDSDNLESVTVPEVIGEKLGRQYYREGLFQERKDLRDIEFDSISYDTEWSTIVPACWIAHVVLTEDVEAAIEYVKSRPVPVERSYDEVKSDAFDANYGERGIPWGKVVSHPNNQDFRFDSFNYLKWTGEDYRGKAKLQPLLFAGARKVAPDHLSGTVTQKLEIKEYLSIGHIWRRDSTVEREVEAFRRARNLAIGDMDPHHEPQPGLLVDAEASLTHALVKQMGHQPGSDAEISQYEEGISRIQDLEEEYEIHPKKVQQELDFLHERLEEARNIS